MTKYESYKLLERKFERARLEREMLENVCEPGCEALASVNSRVLSLAMQMDKAQRRVFA